MALVGIVYRTRCSATRQSAVSERNLVHPVSGLGARLKTYARVEMAQAIRRGGDVLIEAQVECALVDSLGRPQRLPKHGRILSSSKTIGLEYPREVLRIWIPALE